MFFVRDIDVRWKIYTYIFIFLFFIAAIIRIYHYSSTRGVSINDDYMICSPNIKIYHAESAKSFLENNVDIVLDSSMSSIICTLDKVQNGTGEDIDISISFIKKNLSTWPFDRKDIVIYFENKKLKH